MFTVALTGGVASGKSAVADRFAALGVDVADADVVSRELVEPGMPALAEIVAAFGRDVLDANGRLDRRAMRERIFADGAAKKRLEGILHPRVRARLREHAAAARGAYAMIVVPLLVESGHYAWVDRVLVVDVPRALQLERLRARDGIGPALAESMLSAQVTREQRLANADDVIDNSGSLEDLDRAVHALNERYRELAR